MVIEYFSARAEGGGGRGAGAGFGRRKEIPQNPQDADKQGAREASYADGFKSFLGLGHLEKLKSCRHFSQKNHIMRIRQHQSCCLTSDTLSCGRGPHSLG